MNNMNKIKCFHCDKKTVIVITCKCEHLFCVKHQLPENMNVPISFKNMKLKKYN